LLKAACRRPFAVRACHDSCVLPSSNSWPLPVERLADDLAKVLTVGVGRPLRGKATIKVLVAVAAQLAEDPTLPELRHVEDAVRESIGRLGDGAFAKATAVDFGADPTQARLRTAADRRRFAATILGVEISALKENYERRMCTMIAGDLLKRLSAMPVDTARSPIPDAQIIVDVKLTKAEAAVAKGLHAPIVEELRSACQSLEAALKNDAIPTLTILADAIHHSDETQTQQIERLLYLAIDSITEPDGHRHIGIITLFGLGKLRGLDFNQRQSHARHYLSENKDTKLNPYLPGKDQLDIFKDLARPLSRLAARHKVTA
jgi:hypothetical protein